MWLLEYALALSAFAYLMWFAWTTFKPTEPVRHNIEELVIMKIKSTKKAMQESDLNINQYDCARTLVYTLTNILNDREILYDEEAGDKNEQTRDTRSD